MVGLIFLSFYIQEPWRWKSVGDFRVVNSIACEQRYVYIAGANGIIRFDKLKERWETPITRNPFPDSINLIAIDVGANEVWFTTNRAIGRYNPVFEDYQVIEFLTGFANTCSIGISVDYVYLWNRNQCISLNKLNNEWNPLIGNLPQADWFPKTSPSQYPWLAPYYVTDKYLNQYQMSCATQDGQWLWVGTRGQGVYKYNTISQMDEHYVLGIYGARTKAMLKDGDYIWVGNAQEIIRWNLSKGTSNYYLQMEGFTLLGSGIPEVKASEVSSIVGDDKRIWVGTAQGLFQFDRQSETWNRLSSDEITSMTIDKGRIWIGTRSGLAKLENKVISKILNNIWVNDVKTKGDELWVATSKGILRKSGDKWTKFDDQAKILPHGVYRLLFDGDKIYFGTTRQGLLIYENEKWERFTYPVHLPGEKVLSIAVDSVELYVGTDAGVAIWNKQLNLWKKYTKNNSPIKGEVHSILIDKDIVYFGTNYGIVQFTK